MSTNKNMREAKKAKKDEFYTKISDIENEVVYYWDCLKYTIVYCPCDDYRWANFTQDLKDLNFNPSIKYGGGLGTGIINGKAKYARIIIKQK